MRLASHVIYGLLGKSPLNSERLLLDLEETRWLGCWVGHLRKLHRFLPGDWERRLLWRCLMVSTVLLSSCGTLGPAPLSVLLFSSPIHAASFFFGPAITHDSVVLDVDHLSPTPSYKVAWPLPVSMSCSARQS